MRLLIATLLLVASPAAAETLSGRQVAALVEQAVRARAAELPGRVARVTVRGAPSVEVPGGASGLEIRLRDGDDLSGATSVELRTARPDGRVRRVWVNARVHRLVPVVRAARTMKAGRLIGPDDVVESEVDAARARPGALGRAADAIGKELRGRVQRGRPLSAEALRAPVLVRRGDLVTIVAGRGRLTVAAPGRTDADGARGEVVAVTSLATDKRVVGRVRDAGTVEVSSR